MKAATVAATHFTPEEEALLTALDAAAHDLLRLEDQRVGKIAPCWLVCSEETRAEYRRKVIDLANEKCVIPIFSVEHGARQFDRLINRHLVEAWRAAELEAKREREGGNPRAFWT